MDFFFPFHVPLVPSEPDKEARFIGHLRTRLNFPLNWISPPTQSHVLHPLDPQTVREAPDPQKVHHQDIKLLILMSVHGRERLREPEDVAEDVGGEARGEEAGADEEVGGKPAEEGGVGELEDWGVTEGAGDVRW